MLLSSIRRGTVSNSLVKRTWWDSDVFPDIPYPASLTNTLDHIGIKRMDIKNFPLSWRWTQASHAVLPPQALCLLTPLPIDEAAVLCRRGVELFGPNIPTSDASRRIHDASDSEEATRGWLNTLQFESDAEILLAWDPSTAISLPWHVFVAYWDDFCYPSSDDAFLFPKEGSGVLRWHHAEIFEYVENAV